MNKIKITLAPFNNCSYVKTVLLKYILVYIHVQIYIFTHVYLFIFLIQKGSFL